MKRLSLTLYLLAVIVLAIGVFNAIAAGRSFTQDDSPPPDGGIFKWNGQEWKQVPGSGFRISVGPDGSPWIVNSEGIIYRWVNDTFQPVSGRAKDIGVGADGAVWKIGRDGSVSKWNGRGWDRAPGAGVTISVQSNGTPWVVNGAGEIHHWVTDHFELLPGRARDIGAEKSVWLIDQDGLVYNWNHGDWLRDAGAGIATAGNAKRITVGPDGSPWVVNTAREIYHWTDGTFQKFPGAATDIAVGADGSIWMVGIPSTAPPKGIGGQIGSMMRGDAKKDGGPIVGLPPKPDAGPIAERSSKYPAGQKFRHPPSVIPGTDSVTFEFATTQSTVPIIEVSKRPPEPGPRFDRSAVVSAVFPAGAGKQTRHELRVENLKPGTHYYYIITIADEAGGLITETGEFTTSVRID
jgi:hypothetical protein